MCHCEWCLPTYASRSLGRDADLLVTVGDVGGGHAGIVTDTPTQEAVIGEASSN